MSRLGEAILIAAVIFGVGIYASKNVDLNCGNIPLIGSYCVVSK